eukprot:6098560-Pyramimonas_sp.AAC.1
MRRDGCGGAVRILPLGPSVELPAGPQHVWGACPKKFGGAGRTLPLGPSVELSTGPRSVR